MQVTDQWTIIDLVNHRCPITASTWVATFEEARHELEFVSRKLAEKEKELGTWMPLKIDVFLAFEMTPLPMVKVVIVGQDPYPEYGVAMGMSFSSRAAKIPRSLLNIYKELTNDIPGFVIPNHSDLSYWAQQGVLLLNRCLTVQPGAVSSHKDVWGGFITHVIKAISETNPKVIYLLWGKEALKIKNTVGIQGHMLECPHPSFAGVNIKYGNFFGCRHFSQANNILIKQGQAPIDWQIPPKSIDR